MLLCVHLLPHADAGRRFALASEPVAGVEIDPGVPARKRMWPPPAYFLPAGRCQCWWIRWAAGGSGPLWVVGSSPLAMEGTVGATPGAHSRPWARVFVALAPVGGSGGGATFDSDKVPADFERL